MLTFEPHPREFFRPDDPAFRLTLSAERAEVLAAHGVEIVYELPFDHAFSQLSAEAFVDDDEAAKAAKVAAHLQK